jgi:hypothetical protein
MIEKDTKFQALLQQLAMEETPADFTQNIMERVEASAIAKSRQVPLLKTKLMQVLVGIFVLVFVSLLVVCISNQPIVFPFHFTVELPYSYVTQLTSFLIVFWVVMLINQLYQRKEKHAL